MVVEDVVSYENKLFDLAEQFISQTSKSVFLTGKAGTGKTTFLKQIKRTTTKRTVVVAPTGVAAIHAGGTTIHSFFQLPFTPFVPLSAQGNGETMLDRFSLLQNLRIESEKRDLFREIELLIIDEVSMVRCDVLDAIDTILRFFRRKEHLPFGGVQVLFIGDLYQLPPVVRDNEWRILGDHYKSPFFFDAHVIREAQPLYIELKKIYRQRDVTFIEVLNNIRNNRTSPRDIDMLNQRFDPTVQPLSMDGYVTLTTHNHKADKINLEALQHLPGNAVHFAGEVEGEFPEKVFPTEKMLTLKPGAQIMFIKNDMERIRRYYNGKIGIIKEILPNKITVTFPGEDGELEVTKETWRNVRYSYNQNTRQVEEEIIGTFTQYAIRLAWAITIHKSQGLTFEKVIIDAGSSFAAGQVYVALSRCTSIEGIILLSRITSGAIRSDERVISYARNELKESDIDPILDFEQKQYALTKLIDTFDWSILLDEVKIVRDLIEEKKQLDQEHAFHFFDGLETLISDQQRITERFSLQVRSLAKEKDFVYLLKRVEAAIVYFTGVMDNELVPMLKDYSEYLKSEKKVKKIRRKVTALLDLVLSMKKLFNRSTLLANKLQQAEEEKRDSHGPSLS